MKSWGKGQYDRSISWPVGMIVAVLAASGGAAHAQDISIDAPEGTPHQEQVAGAAEEHKVIPGAFSATTTLTSDYVFRGISQSDEGAALQGSLDWKHDSGLFVGVWGSSVDFNDGDQASVELDWYAGFGNRIMGFTYDVRAIYYSYPGADVARDYDYWELGLALGYEPLPDLNLTVGYNVSPDFFAESGVAHYAYGEAKYALGMLPVPLTVKAGLARQWIDNNAAFGTPDYWHWSAGIGLTVEGVDLSVAYSDTDIGRNECGAALDVCGARFIFAASYAL